MSTQILKVDISYAKAQEVIRQKHHPLKNFLIRYKVRNFNSKVHIRIIYKVPKNLEEGD